MKLLVKLFVPCESYGERCYDISEDKFGVQEIIGYHVHVHSNAVPMAEFANSRCIQFKVGKEYWRFIIESMGECKYGEADSQKAQSNSK